MHHASRRTLVQALIASLLIHALILLRVVGLSPVQINAPAATINVMVRQEVRSVPPKPVSAPVARSLAEPVRPASPKPHTVATPQLAVPEPSSSSAAALPAQPEPRELSQPPPSALPAASAGGSAPKAAAAPAPVREGVSADELRQYRLSLATAAKRFKRYPALARERGWEGSVDIALNGSSLLPEPEIVLLRSSGRTLLDEQALAMMTQAARVTTLPEGMRGRNFRIQLTMEFNLENDQ